MRDYAPEPRSYELMTVLSPDVGEDDIPVALERIERYVSDAGGTVDEVLRDSPWGRRRLAYPIRYASRDVRDGYYSVCHISMVPGRVTEVERELKLNTDVIRYLLTLYTAPPVDPRAVEAAEIAAEDAAAEAYAAAQAAAAGGDADASAPDEDGPAPDADASAPDEDGPAPDADASAPVARNVAPEDTAHDEELTETSNPGDRGADVLDPTSVPQPLDEPAAPADERHTGNGTETVDEGPSDTQAPSDADTAPSEPPVTGDERAVEDEED